MPPKFNHIRTLKDVYEVYFSWNSKYDPTKPALVGVDDNVSESPFRCPVTAQPVNGQHPFSLIIACGHVLSEKGLQQIDQNMCCFVCQKYYNKSDILPLNPDEKSQEKLRNKLNIQRSTEDISNNPNNNNNTNNNNNNKNNTNNNNNNNNKNI